MSRREDDKMWAEREATITAIEKTAVALRKDGSAERWCHAVRSLFVLSCPHFVCYLHRMRGADDKIKRLCKDINGPLWEVTRAINIRPHPHISWQHVPGTGQEDSLP